MIRYTLPVLLVLGGVVIGLAAPRVMVPAAATQAEPPRTGLISGSAYCLRESLPHNQTARIWAARIDPDGKKRCYWSDMPEVVQ